MRLALALLAACAGDPSKDEEETGGAPTPTGPTPTSSPTDTVTTGPTGTPTSPARVDPAVVLTGVPGFGIGQLLTLLPGVAGEPGTLILSGIQDDGKPEMMLLPGDLPRGEQPLLDLWDGASRSPILQWTPAGDADGDGHADAWGWGTLFLGPLLGRTLDPGTGAAFIAAGEGTVAAAGFDADGDGVGDALVLDGFPGFVEYGPFEGRVARDPGPPASFAQLGDEPCQDSAVAATVLRDALGPGHDAVAIGQGRSVTDSECPEIIQVWDLAVAPGIVLPWEGALATATLDYGGFVAGIGDVTGDGTGDLLVGDATGSRIVAGPVGSAPTLEAAPAAVEVRDGTLEAALGDVNGDGAPDLLARVDQADGSVTWSVALSPFAAVIELRAAVPLTTDAIAAAGEVRSADIDGDGLAEVASNHAVLDPDAGEVRIWSGADIAAAIP